MEEIRFLLQSMIAQTFNTNVLRIALNMQEDKIASVIVSKYSCKIDEEMVMRAVKTAQMDFL